MDAPLPPLDGSLPSVLEFADFHAAHNPTLPWFIFPSRDAPDSTSSITFHEMNQASHRAAHMFRPGRQGPDGEVVALVLNTDIVLYITVLLGLFRAGLIVRPIIVSRQKLCIKVALSHILCRHATPRKASAI